jgi:hypothetical protein
VQLLPDPPGLQGGAIAQLGERLVCNQKVAGSIPAGSTSFYLPPATRKRVMTRVHVNRNKKVPTCAGVITRFIACSEGDADQRIACSLTIWKVFVLTLNFQAKI